MYRRGAGFPVAYFSRGVCRSVVVRTGLIRTTARAPIATVSEGRGAPDSAWCHEHTGGMERAPELLS